MNKYEPRNTSEAGHLAATVPASSKAQSPSQQRWFLDDRDPKPYRHPTIDLSLLTKREIEAFTYLAQGLNMPEVAKLMKTDEGEAISRHTVADHEKAAYKKLGLSNRAELVKAAIATGHISLAEGESLQEMIAAYKTMTPRCKQVLERIALGDTNNQIGAFLGMAGVTVNDFKRQIYKVLAIDNVADATRIWVNLKIAADRQMGFIIPDAQPDPKANWFKDFEKSGPYQHPDISVIQTFSDKEWDAFQLLAKGLSLVEVAIQFSEIYPDAGANLHTIIHLENLIATKIGTHNRATMAKMAIANKDIKPVTGPALQQLIDSYNTLSPIKKQVLESSAQGYSTRETATQLSLTPNQVENNKRKIFKAFDINNVAQATTIWVMLKLEADRLLKEQIKSPGESPSGAVETNHHEGAATSMAAPTISFAERFPKPDVAAVTSFTDRTQASRSQQPRHWR